MYHETIISFLYVANDDLRVLIYHCLIIKQIHQSLHYCFLCPLIFLPNSKNFKFLTYIPLTFPANGDLRVRVLYIILRNYTSAITIGSHRCYFYHRSTYQRYVAVTWDDYNVSFYGHWWSASPRYYYKCATIS